MLMSHQDMSASWGLGGSGAHAAAGGWLRPAASSCLHVAACLRESLGAVRCCISTPADSWLGHVITCMHVDPPCFRSQEPADSRAAPDRNDAVSLRRTQRSPARCSLAILLSTCSHLQLAACALVAIMHRRDFVSGTRSRLRCSCSAVAMRLRKMLRCQCVLPCLLHGIGCPGAQSAARSGRLSRPLRVSL